MTYSVLIIMFETITIVNNPRGRDYGGIANMHEFLFVYKKSEKAKLNTIDDPDKEFPYTDEISGFELRELEKSKYSISH